MKHGNEPHILNAASNLMGICFVVITGLKITHNDIETYADEISLLASFGFLCSCVLSYLSLRSKTQNRIYERLADYLFLFSITALFLAVLVFAIGIKRFG